MVVTSCCSCYLFPPQFSSVYLGWKYFLQVSWEDRKYRLRDTVYSPEGSLPAAAVWASLTRHEARPAGHRCTAALRGRGRGGLCSHAAPPATGGLSSFALCSQRALRARARGTVNAPLPGCKGPLMPPPPLLLCPSDCSCGD